MILDKAVELFDSVGYRNASLADLITATGVSKGAFYYHFTNRESVATAIIEEADDMLQTTARGILSDTSRRALGNLIQFVMEIAGLSRSVALLRVGIQLRGGLGQISTATEGYQAHRELFTGVARMGITEGDLRAELDAEQIGNTLWAAVLGTHQHCDATQEDIQLYLADVFAIVLPAVCTPVALSDHLVQVKQLCGRGADPRA